MRALALALALSGCAVAVERDCGAECSDTLRCEAPGERWECLGPDGYRGTFCDFPGAREPLSESCARACYAAGACDSPTDTSPVYVCRCAGEE